ncbi:MAG: hypothetical protein Kow00114_27410 [Kiloniellaceae bacterium]
MTAPPVRIPARPPHRFCRECGQPFYPKRVDQACCSTPCRTARHDRERNHGRALYRLVTAWRLDRSKGALSDLTQYADLIAQEERSRRARNAEIRKQAEKEMSR